MRKNGDSLKKIQLVSAAVLVADAYEMTYAALLGAGRSDTDSLVQATTAVAKMFWGSFPMAGLEGGVQMRRMFGHDWSEKALACGWQSATSRALHLAREMRSPMAVRYGLYAAHHTKIWNLAPDIHGLITSVEPLEGIMGVVELRPSPPGSLLELAAPFVVRHKMELMRDVDSMIKAQKKLGCNIVYLNVSDKNLWL